jgi:hypothetical protein
MPQTDLQKQEKKYKHNRAAHNNRAISEENG